MRGPDPMYQPEFPKEFVREAHQICRQPTAERRQWQRAKMVVLLDERPAMSCPELGEQVGLDKTSVRRWKKRWASGEFSLDDREGRGRKPKFDGL